jgi:hypothetical protein
VFELALRVFPAVTRLTVYCWLHIPKQVWLAGALARINLWLVELNCFPNRSSAQRVIMRAGRKWATLGGKLYGEIVVWNGACSGCVHQIVMKLRINHLQVSRKVFLEAHDNWRRGSRDLLKDRFWLHEENASWRRLRPLDVAKWTSQSPKVCAGAQGWKPMTRRA